MKLGVYGGSFNPPHLGHLNLALELSEVLDLKNVIVIPSNISPQKENDGGVEPYHRVNMCKIAFSDDIFHVSSMEIDRGGVSYTYDTLKLIKETYNNPEIYLFTGSDMFLTFDTWRRYSDILKMCTVCAASRSNVETYKEMTEYAKSCLRSDNIRIFNLKPFEASSTEIRYKIKNNDDCSDVLPKGVYDYIKKNNLYGYREI